MAVRFLLRRLFSAFLVLAAVSLLVFVLLDQTPGDAVDTLLGDSASVSQQEMLRHQLGLDRPLLVRYLYFARAALWHGDLGRSLISGQEVSTLVLARFGYTLTLTLTATLLALAWGLLAGTMAAARAGGLTDLAITAVATLGLSAPTFWVALLLVLLFSLRLKWLPVQGAAGPSHLVLPALTLALPMAAVVARLVRASLLEVQQSDYVQTARAKGLPTRLIWRRHILRNSLIPLLTLLALHLGRLLGGMFIVETIFAWPGLGRLLVQAIFDRDFPVVTGAALLTATIYQGLNLVVDVSHAFLDPRVAGETL